MYGQSGQAAFQGVFQVDPAQMEALYQTAIDLADFQGDETCVELYAGTGTIGMAMAGHVKEVVGVEIVPEAVENANENVRWNGLENCRYVCQDATAFVGEYAGACDVLVVDPPRKGMSEEGICHIESWIPKRSFTFRAIPRRSGAMWSVWPKAAIAAKSSSLSTCFRIRRVSSAWRGS